MPAICTAPINRPVTFCGCGTIRDRPETVGDGFSEGGLGSELDGLEAQSTKGVGGDPTKREAVQD